MSDSIVIARAGVEDAEAILRLQSLAYRSEAMIYDDFSIPPLTQTLEHLQSEFKRKVILIANANGQIVGSVRAYQMNHTCYVERLLVHPNFQNRGIGKRLMNQIEKDFASANRFELFTGHKSEKNIRLYSKLGYKIFKQEIVTDRLTFVFMEKKTSCSLT